MSIFMECLLHAIQGVLCIAILVVALIWLNKDSHERKSKKYDIMLTFLTIALAVSSVGVFIADVLEGDVGHYGTSFFVALVSIVIVVFVAELDPFRKKEHEDENEEGTSKEEDEV